MVDLATYCHDRDLERLYDNFQSHSDSHNYPFNNKHIIHQRVLIDHPKEGVKNHYIAESDYDQILKTFNINPDNKEADDYTHGWNGPHYWKHHCVNHLKALMVSSADFIVFADADCHIITHGRSWVDTAIDILNKRPEVLLVSPSDGNSGDTQNMSQQLFIANRERLMKIDFDLPFEGFTEGGPMQEYYFMLEGRIGRYMEKHDLYRHILPINYRYWHKQWH